MHLDVIQASRFIEALTGDADTPITFQTFDDSGQGRPLARIIHGSLSQSVDTLNRLQEQGAGVFVAVNATDGHGRTAKNIVSVRALFVDADDTELVLDVRVPKPTIIVRSARGKHAYWVLNGTDKLEDFRPAQEQLAAAYGTDPQVKDLPRVMRLPGSWHQKREPVMVELEQINFSGPYTVAEVVGGLPPIAEPVHEIPRRTAGRAESTFDEAVEAFNRENAYPLPKIPGPCPMCDHKGCFHEYPKGSARWFCFSSNHTDTDGGLRGADGYHGDALDIAANQARLSRSQVLRRDGYLGSSSNHTHRQTLSPGSGTREEQPKQAKARLRTMGELLDDWLKADARRFLPTGISAIDTPIGGGLPVGFTTMFLAGTNVGKSEAVRQVARGAAKGGHHVLYLDGELSDVIMGDRWVAQAAQIPALTLSKRGSWTSPQTADIAKGIEDIRGLPIRTAFLDPIQTSELESLIADALAEAPTDKPQLIILDSVHHFSYGFDAKDRRGQVEGFVRWANKMARQTGAAFLLVAEQKRQMQGESPLGAESRSLEFQAHVSISFEEVDQVADQVAGDAGGTWERAVRLTVLKNRVGRKGRVEEQLVYVGPFWDMRVEAAEDERIEKVVGVMNREWMTAREIEKSCKARNGSLKSLLEMLVGREILEKVRITGNFAATKYRLALSPQESNFHAVPGTRGHGRDNESRG